MTEQIMLEGLVALTPPDVPLVSPAEEAPVEDTPKTKTWYVWEHVDGSCENFPLGVFSHSVELASEEPAPENGFEFAPPEAKEGYRVFFLKGAWITLPEQIDAAPIKQQLLALVEDDYKRKMSAGYPEFEQATWQMQERDAREFLKDGTTSTFLKELFDNRTASDKSMKEFCKSIVSNADAYNKGLAKTLAEFQSKRFALSKANSIQDLATASGNSVGKLLYYFAPKVTAPALP